MDCTTPTAQTTPARVMLLCVWLDDAAVWHARIVTPDAQSHEFTSPFVLAQFLAHSTRTAPRPAIGGGLR
jgi:hypothetical protein